MSYSPAQHRPENHHRRDTHIDTSPDTRNLPSALRMFWRTQMMRLTIMGADGSLLSHTVTVQTVWIRGSPEAREKRTAGVAP